MGIVLQKTKLAEKLLEAMSELFGNVRGGLCCLHYSSWLITRPLYTGVVGASVVAMGVISLPVIFKHHYTKTLASGVICASGTLGQIHPPSIVLIILTDVLGVPVGDLFKGAVMPSLILVGSYILYVLIIAQFDKQAAPAFKGKNYDLKKSTQYLLVAKAILPPLSLIIAVLGSIFSGIATTHPLNLPQVVR